MQTARPLPRPGYEGPRCFGPVRVAHRSSVSDGFAREIRATGGDVSDFHGIQPYRMEVRGKEVFPLLVDGLGRARSGTWGQAQCLAFVRRQPSTGEVTGSLDPTGDAGIDHGPRGRDLRSGREP